MSSDNVSISISTGPLLIAIAAMLWGTDALFRVPTVKEVDPTFIVLFEHLIGTVALGIWAFFRNREKMTRLPAMTWISLFVIGAGGSAMATVLFTASFQYINPSIAILLQKLQPVLVIFFAFLFLRETPSRGFWIWSPVALIAALLISFPDLNFHFLSKGIDWHSQGVIYASAAASLWALTTVAGKSVVKEVPAAVVTFWRYFFGLLVLIVLFFSSGEGLPLQAMRNPETLHALLYMAFVPGISALIFYYNGLNRTLASTATFVELLFPISAVVLNWIFLHAQLLPMQVIGGIVLLYSVARLSLN